jgi:hypothetical protein
MLHALSTIAHQVMTAPSFRPAFIYFEAMAPRCRALANPPRCRALANEMMYKNLIKLHLNDPKPRQAMRRWNTTNLALVTLHHEKFLCEVARTGCCIHVEMLTKCIHEHFNSGCSHAFAQKLADALAFCRAKLKGKPSRRYHSKTILTGQITSKTASAVKAVISAINGSIVVASSDEGEAAEDLDAPCSSRLLLEEEDAPGDMVGGAAAALQRLQEAFGESQGSTTACSSCSPDDA